MAKASISFGPFVLSPEEGSLRRDGVSIAIGNRGFALLRTLLEADGEVVTKDGLINAAWPSATIEESNLTVQIAALRKVLGVAPDGEEWIATVPRVGYRLIRSRTDVPKRTGPILPLHHGKPAIAILPFLNPSNEEEESYFADGLAEDLITDLSKVPGLVVIARASSFRYRGSDIDIGTVSQELGVRYLVQGSVRRSAARIRVSAQVIDVASRGLLWADRFDRELGDVFALQDEIAGRIVGALSSVLPQVDRPRPRRATRIEAYDAFVRGRALVKRSVDGSLEAQPLFQKAIDIDPEFADAHSWLAISLVFGWLYSGDPIERYGVGVEAARRAVSLDPVNAGAHAILGLLLVYGGNLGEAADHLDTALGTDPNHADGWLFRACLKVNQGMPEEGIDNVRTAFSLNPQPQGMYYWILGYAQYAAGRYEEAIATLTNPLTHYTLSQRILAASLAKVGRIDEAQAEARQFLQANPHFTIKHWAATDHFARESDLTHFVEGYLKAGLPMG